MGTQRARIRLINRFEAFYSIHDFLAAFEINRRGENVLLSITISINFQPPSDRTNDRPTIRNREVSAQKRSRKGKKGREGVGYSKKSTSRFDPPLCSRLFNPIRALLFPFVRGHRINDSHAYDSVNLCMEEEKSLHCSKDGG